MSIAPALGLTLVAPAVALQAQTEETSPSTRVSTQGSSATQNEQQGQEDAGKSAGYARPFRSTSWWNTPLGRAPRDPHSGAYIRDSRNRAHTQNYLKLVLGDWGMPSYRSDRSDPLYRINPASGPSMRVHIPAHATQMRADDASLSIVDTRTHKVVGLSGANFKGGRWTATGASRYFIRSNGVEESLPGGTKGNQGHRGIPSSTQVVTKREIRRGAIRHRLEVYWWETASRTPRGRDAYFPMPNSESGKNGIVPEGIVLRIKRSVD
ncbi:MAG: hypothetical protein ABJA81_07750, partial [Nocardioidaceae bacterium]